MRFKGMSAFMFLLLPGILAGQSALLDLKDCLKQGRRSGPGAGVIRQEIKALAADRKADISRYRPQLSLSADLPGLNRSINSVTQPDGSVLFIAQGQMFSTMSLNLNQRLTATGATIYMSSSLSRVDALNTSEFHYQVSPMVIGIMQPLFRVNEYRYQRDQDALMYELEKRELLEEMLQNDRNIIALFFEGIVARMDVEISRLNTTVNDSIYKLSKRRYNVGKIAENDLLESELALMNAELALATGMADEEFAMSNLMLHIGVEGEMTITLADPPPFPKLQIDEADAVHYAGIYGSAGPRSELSQLQQESNVKRARYARRLEANLNVSAGFDKSADDLNNIGSDLLDRQRVSIGLEIPLFSWGEKKARIEEALAEQAREDIVLQLSRDELDQQVRQRVREVKRFQDQLLIATRADTIAQRRFEVTRKRYLIGKVDITTLLQAQEARDNARKNYISTLRSLWLAYYDLKRECLYDFESGRPVNFQNFGIAIY